MKQTTAVFLNRQPAVSTGKRFTLFVIKIPCRSLTDPFPQSSIKRLTNMTNGYGKFKWRLIGPALFGAISNVVTSV